MRKCLRDFGIEVEISSGYGSGCIDDGADARAVRSAEDRTELDDDVGGSQNGFRWGVYDERGLRW